MDSLLGGASFRVQADALLRKNLTFQKRNIGANLRLILFPLILCILLDALQVLIDHEMDTPKNKCGCNPNDKNECGIEWSNATQASSCPIPNPKEWPPVLRVPEPDRRAVRTDANKLSGLPDNSCRSKGSCPATILYTGENQTFVKDLAGKIFTNNIFYNPSDVAYSMAKNVLGSSKKMDPVNFLDPAFVSDAPLYYLQSECNAKTARKVTMKFAPNAPPKELTCVEGLLVPRKNSDEINDELHKSEETGNEMVGAYDFSNSNFNNFNVKVWYNATKRKGDGINPVPLLRVPRAVNLISNTYLQSLRGRTVEMLLEFVKEMPKPKTRMTIDFASLLGPMFFTWVILQLFPVILTALVYEKEARLRLMMKMHGLGDGPYWSITYEYFALLSVLYMLCFVVFGSVIGLKFFTTNSYLVQLVFYLLVINLQIACAFLLSAMFSDVKTAAVVGYIIVFGTGLLGGFLFNEFLQNPSFPRGWITVLEIFPGFSLYRGLYELSQYAFMASQTGKGMVFRDLKDPENGLKTVFKIMIFEGAIIMSLSYYIDQVVTSGRSPLFFMENVQKKKNLASRSSKRILDREGAEVLVEMDKPDVAQEKVKVEKLLHDPASQAILCYDLKKIYPSRDGNPEKFAVRGMNLALPKGECFGMLGTNGAGKTTFMSMMIGLVKPTSGTAYINGLDIGTQMNEIYNCIGVCPQYDLLWATLTGREHLLFYGRLKNMKGAELAHAVEESLKSVNLTGVADKRSGSYSGGMKRRLSVAISLIGDPKVVYMDEPSTGLDPASRNFLWSAVKRAKQDRAIVLTTHSMEEAEYLCDRLGIFVDGSLQCVGNAKELKARYGGSYVFTVTTSSEHEEQVVNMVQNLSRNAKKVYHLSGTQKFELPKQEVRIADVFLAVEKAKNRFVIQAWGLTDTTLEDVFIEVAREAQSSVL